mmetsp:Transcript_6748/g.11316  ORF Transcript_6748/g.11316 Transcript_6748/m.11316 type:complete len:190 (+) Transcript_6748:1823-2392(+)
MGDRNQKHISPRFQKTCLRTVYGLLSLFEYAGDQVKLLRRLLDEDKALADDDSSLSIFVGSLVKPLMVQGGFQKEYLEFAVNQLFPKTMDVLADDAPHISNMTQQLQSSLNFFVILKAKFKHDPLFSGFKEKACKEYFGNISKALKTAEDQSKDEERSAEQTEDEVMRAGSLMELRFKQQQREIVRDLL